MHFSNLPGEVLIGQVLDEYQNRFLPESDSQLLRAQFACLVQLPNESAQKLHARMRVLYHLAYPDPNTRNEVYLTEKFISALNNRKVQTTFAVGSLPHIPRHCTLQMRRLRSS